MPSCDAMEEIGESIDLKWTENYVKGVCTKIEKTHTRTRPVQAECLADKLCPKTMRMWKNKRSLALDTAWKIRDSPFL